MERRDNRAEEIAKKQTEYSGATQVLPVALPVRTIANYDILLQKLSEETVRFISHG